jgi:hypothetical protein
MAATQAISAGGLRRHELFIRRRLAFRVADTCFGMFSSGEITMALDPGLHPFLTDLCRCEVRIGVEWADDIQIPNRAPSFDSGGLWTAFEEPSGHRFYFSTPRLGSAPYKALWIDRSFSQGRLLLRRACFDATRPVYPLEYPLDELLMIHRLARGEGVEMHAMGLIGEDGRGHLFLGHSGAGKSTAARLWQSESGAHILSDDRIVLRVRDGQIWMYGTPWHGDAGIASPAAAPLYRAYLLEHGDRSELSGVSKGRAAAEFLARCFAPHYSAEALQFTLQFLDRVAQAVPCFLFRFLPDQSAVEAICRAAA